MKLNKKFLILLLIIIAITIIFWLINIPSKKEMTLLGVEHTHIGFNNIIQESDTFNILVNEYMYNGGGVAIADFNNDNMEDIYFTGNLVDNKLYLNKGNMIFEEVTQEANALCSGKWSMGASVIDINQDGLLDIYISVSASTDSIDRKNVLLVNQRITHAGIPIFKDEASKYRIDHPGYSIHALFFDYNQDGWMDMYLLNNHFINRGNALSTRNLKNHSLDKNINILFKNMKGKYFEDVTKTSGLLNNAFSLGAIILDVNQDGWLDIFVSNDFVTSSTLFVNQKDETFVNQVDDFLPHQSLSSMGVDLSDFNNDGQDDLITLDMLPQTLDRTKRMFSKSNFLFYDLLRKYDESPQYTRNCLYVGQPVSKYQEISQLMKVHQTDWSWSPIFADLDNDGYKDLYITNGFPRDITDLDFINFRDSYQSILSTNYGLLEKIPSIKISNVMYHNTKKYTFENVTVPWNMKVSSHSYGQSMADLDKDGDLDVVVNNLNDRAFVFQNNLSDGNYLRVKLKGNMRNPMALHTKVRIYSNGQLQTGSVNPYRGYLSSLSSIIHFGLGQNDKIDSMYIEWSPNQITVIKEVKINQVLSIDYHDVEKYIMKKTFTNDVLLQEVSNDIGLNFNHTDNKSYDYYTYELHQRVYSNDGPPICVGDLNGDGLEDLVIGNGSGAKSCIFFQKKEGTFRKEVLSFDFVEKEITILHLFDIDNDDDLDIYIGYGHNSTMDTTQWQDIAALNDGKGVFSLFSESIPKFYAHTTSVLSTDLDHDGDSDLIVGSRAKPLDYPKSPKTRILINDHAKFVDNTDNWLPNKGYLGMVSDIEMIDLNEDGEKDIILLGEWNGINTYVKSGKIFQQTTKYFGEKLNGLWNELHIADLDNDGDKDILAGNHGLNIPYHATEENPMLMIYKDFYQDGRVEPVVFCYTDEDYYPIHLRDNLLNQMQPKKKQFTSYQSYSKASLDVLFTEEDLENSNRLTVHTLASMAFENKDGEFIRHSLPIEAQFSPIFAFLTTDIDADSNVDILIAGNDNAAEVFTGPKNALNGLVLSIGDNFSFQLLPYQTSGFLAQGSVKYLKKIKVKNEDYYLVLQNKGRLLAYRK